MENETQLNDQGSINSDSPIEDSSLAPPASSTCPSIILGEENLEGECFGGVDRENGIHFSIPSPVPDLRSEDEKMAFEAHLISAVGKIFRKLGFHKRSIEELKQLESTDPLLKGAERIEGIPHAMIARDVIRPIVTERYSVGLDVLCMEFPFSTIPRYCEDLELQKVLRKSYNTGKAGVFVVIPSYGEPDENGITPVTFNLIIYLNTLPYEFLAKKNEDLARCFRTYLVATELICGYRGFVHALEHFLLENELLQFHEHSVLVDYSAESSPMIVTAANYEETMNSRAPFHHATSSDVIRLLCSYKAIHRKLELIRNGMGLDQFTIGDWTAALLDEKFDRASIRRDFLNRYRLHWETHQRVDFRIVRRKTWEYFLTTCCD